ncbi:MAG: ATP-grasp domain-containing protein [Alphaproteobacteria bacterium]
MQRPNRTRNLLILQSAHLQDPSDWIAIQQRIQRDAPDIEVRIANNGHRNSVTARWQVQRPSLVFSPIYLIDFVPRGGAVFCGRVLGKDEDLRRLSSIGILTPNTTMLSPASSFDPNEWGDYVIVKANSLNSGKGVKLVRTTDISMRYDELTTFANDRFLVQPYIDHAEDGYPTEYRVMTMFGRALYCARNRWGNKRPPLAEIAADPQGIIASNNNTMGGHVRSICNDAEIIALGGRAHHAFPECPVLGVDIIRERQSGRLYVLEVNAHGAVWHLSSPFAKKIDPEYARARYAQFNALDRAADLLIQKTRTEAR